MNSMRICFYGPRLGLPDPKYQRTSDPGQASHLLDARLVRVEQWPRLHVFRHQAAAHAGDVLPVPQGQQCHVLFRGLPLPCGYQWRAHTRAQQNKRPVLGQGLRGTKKTHLQFTVGKLRHRGRRGLPKLSAASWAQQSLCPWVSSAWENLTREFWAMRSGKRKTHILSQHPEDGWHWFPGRDTC